MCLLRSVCCAIDEYDVIPAKQCKIHKMEMEQQNKIEIIYNNSTNNKRKIGCYFGCNFKPFRDEDGGSDDEEVNTKAYFYQHRKSIKLNNHNNRSDMYSCGYSCLSGHRHQSTTAHSIQCLFTDYYIHTLFHLLYYSAFFFSLILNVYA